MPRLSDKDYFVLVSPGEQGANGEESSRYTSGADTPPRDELFDAARNGKYVYGKGTVQRANGKPLPPQQVELYVGCGPAVSETLQERYAQIVEALGNLGAIAYVQQEVVFPSAWA